MDTLLQFLSNYTNVWIVNAVLFVALVTIAVLRFRDKRTRSDLMRDSYTAGYAAAEAINLETLVAKWRTKNSALLETWGSVETGIGMTAYGPAEIERTKQIIAAVYRGGGSVDECAQLAQVETDYACMVLADCGLLPGDVLETVENPMVSTDNSDSMLKHLHRIETSDMMGTTPDPVEAGDFDEHVSIYEDWRDNGTSLLTDHRPKTKVKDQRTPMQLIAFDSAGYMD